MINCNDLVQTHYYRDIQVNAPSPEQTAIAELQKEVEDINKELVDLSSKVIEDRYILFVGDSYAGETASYTGGTGAKSGWPSYCNYMVRNLKASYTTANGGAGFGKEGNKAISTLLSNWISSTEGQANKDKLTDVVFALGYNDSLSLGLDNTYASKIVNGITACNNLIKANMPQAKPWLFSIGWGSNPKMRLGADKVYNQLYPTCEMVKWTYCTAHPIMYIAARFAADRVHPNDDGMMRLGQYISNCLNYGKSEYNEEAQAITQNNLYQVVNGSEILVLLNDYVIYNGSLITQAKDQTLKIATLNNAFTFGCENKGTTASPNGGFKQLLSFHIAGGSANKHVNLMASLVSVEAGSKYGHMTYDTVLTITNISNETIDYTKAATDWGKLSINPYRG